MNVWTFAALVGLLAVFLIANMVRGLAEHEAFAEREAMTISR